MFKSQFNSFINQIQYWFSQVKASKPEEVLYELPDNLEGICQQTLEQLSIPLPYQTAIQEALTSAVINWQNNPHTANSLVILGNPVQSISEILLESIEIWKPEDCQLITPIDWSIRPPYPQQIIEKLREALKPYDQSSEDHHHNKSESSISNQVIVIPSLDQCFLRCIQGWKGIEELRNIIHQNRYYFWIIGCNNWTWKFLDAVCQNSAYFNDLLCLPALEAEELCQWILSVQPEEIALQMSWEENESYWNSLAKVSSGVSSVAAHLWLHSLRIREIDLPDNESKEVEKFPSILKTVSDPLDESVLVKMKLINPILPDLPSLSPNERYLLHCILIHGELTLLQLVLSLGEQESLIQAQLQSLLQKEIVIQQEQQFKVSPAYYPILETELSHNNFLIV